MFVIPETANHLASVTFASVTGKQDRQVDGEIVTKTIFNRMTRSLWGGCFVL